MNVLVEVAERIALVTLNRPDRLNALDFATIDRLQALLDGFEADGGVGAVILTGAGERAFSAGADIHEFTGSVRAGAVVAVRDFVLRGQRLTARIERFPKPVIVAVNGLAYGGGCEITEAAPLALASERASFAKPEIRLGMPPTFGGTQRLPRLAGRKRALALLLSGEPFSAAHALEIGLVNQVVPHEQLLPAARGLAGRILRHTPEAIAAVLAAATGGLDLSIGDGLALEAEQFRRVAASGRLLPGLDAWTARRDRDARALKLNPAG